MTIDKPHTMTQKSRRYSLWPLLPLALALVLVLVCSAATLVRSVTFNRCEFSCSEDLGRGSCDSDGTCTCSTGWSGIACDVPSQALSKVSRLDGTYGYVFNTSGTSYKENRVSDLVYDTIKGVMYVYGLDENGSPRVFEMDPRYPETFTADGITSRGWGPTSGPRRASTIKPVALTVETEFCGPGMTSSCVAKHPRAYGHSDPTKSRGWYGVYSKLALDVSATLTGVYAPLNMWHPTVSNRFKFRIVKYVGTVCPTDTSLWDSCMLGTASSGEHSNNFEKDGYILDAMGTDPNNGIVVYKASHEDGVSSGVLGILGSTLVSRGELTLQPSLLASKCASCATAPDALRLETSISYSDTVVAVNYVIFAGSALLDDVNGIYYPALFKVNTAPSALTGDGVEMYLDTTSVKVLDTCEGQLDAKQGRFSTFTAMTSHDGKGYVGTSGRDGDCDGCYRRAACIFMFDLGFAEGASPTAVIALDANLGERDVMSATVQPAATPSDKTYMFWAVGKRDGETSRIVKIEIGGSDTSSACTSGCFRRVASIEESFPFAGIRYIPSTSGIFAVSSSESTATYVKYSTVVISSVEPKYVSTATSGKSIQILGSGFYSQTLESDQSHSIACRFGHSLESHDGFSTTSWSAATFVSSSEVTCVAPASADSNSTTLGYTEVQVSFDGFPSDSTDPTGIWESSMWNSGDSHVLYHDPVVVVETKIESSAAQVLYTGEDVDEKPVTLRVLGGPFINSADLKCKFDDADTSIVSATFVSESEITCPICTVVDGRCNNPPGSPLPWLSSGAPADVSVAVTLNGLDYGSSTGSLKLYGPPAGVKVLSTAPTYRAFKADSTFSLDSFTVGLVDLNGFSIPNDMGIGGSKGFTISAVLNGPSTVAIVSSTASAQTVNGVATLALELDDVPPAGEYTITFTGADCTDASCSSNLATSAHAYFSVEPGSASGLNVVPGSSRGNALYITDGALFPSDVVILSGAKTVNVGHLTVSIIDVARNELGSLSTEDVSVTASLVVGSVDANGEYEMRAQGAQLSGTLIKATANGRVSFSDLVLTASGNSGTRAVGSTADITYGGATRGDYGEASKYIIQFAASIGNVPVLAHSILRIDVGEPVYLRINGTYSPITTYAEASKQPVGEIIIGAYDGGNNFVGTAETALRNVHVEATVGITLDGTLDLARGIDTGIWRFSDITIVSPTAVNFELKFTSADLTPVIQVVNVLAGNAGYKLVPTTLSLTPLVAASAVQFDSFAVNVFDWTNNALGTGDRHSTGDGDAPNRRIRVTCETLTLTGSVEVFTNGTGTASIPALSATLPKAGTHTIVVSEYDADVNGETRAGRLQSASVTITISAGAVSGFKVSTSAQLEYTTSFSESLQVSEISAYSVGDTIPLANFEVVPVDVAGNESPTGTLPSGITLTASMNDSSRDIYPYILGANETTIAREAVLTVYADTSLYPRTGSLIATTSSAGVATFSGLHLVKPKTGTYTLTFASGSSSYTSAVAELKITPGRSQHVGLLPYCDLSADASVCDESTNCTCNTYRAASDVPLHPISAYILDGALNPVGDFDTKSCETCPDRKIILSPKNVTLCHGVTNGGDACECAGLASATSTLDGKLCSPTVAIEVIPESGLGYFDAIFIAAPKVGTYAIELYSPGLTSVEYYFSVSLGVAAAFVLDSVQASSVLNSEVETAISTSSNPLVGRLYDGGGNFMSTATHGEQIFVSCETATLAEYPQGINPVIGGKTYAASCGSVALCASQSATAGVVEFKNLVLLAPTANVHTIIFTMNDKQVASYEVTVQLGQASKLIVANSPETSYQAAASTKLGLIEITIADGAGNVLGTSNTDAFIITTAMTGPRHTFRTTAGRNRTIGSGYGNVLFSDLIVDTPEVGNYLLTFSCIGCAALGLVIEPMSFGFSVYLGDPAALAVATSYTSHSTGETLTLQSSYSTAREVPLNSFVVQVIDGASNVLNLQYEIDVEATPVSVASCTTSAVEMAYTPQSVISGVAIFDDIVVKRPCTGTYHLTFSSPGLSSVSTLLTFSTGYPSTIDVCTVNSYTRVETGLCNDTHTYVGASDMVVQSFSAQLTDPGGLHVGNAWDAEARNVTVELESFVLAPGQPEVVSSPSLIADWSGSLLASSGAVGWCADTMDANPRNVVVRNPLTGGLSYEVRYSNPAAAYCREISYSGVAPDTHYNVGLKIDIGLAGVYRLRIASYCGPERCPGAIYPTLETDLLQFTVIPGAPAALKMLTAPPFVNENDFALIPAPEIVLVDSVGNVCTQVDTSIAVSVTPSLTNLLGAVGEMVSGAVKFDNLKLVGERGAEYRLTFTSDTYSLSTTSERPLTVMNCSSIKPNSALYNGECSCMPGFTSDLSGETGYTADLDSFYIESNTTLYKTTIGSTDWISALHPYGVCVPCANGFYKSSHGADACVSCPDRMDTARSDGILRNQYYASSGTLVLGSLAHVGKDACHCISQTQTPFLSYYRQLPLDAYLCGDCPVGGECDGDVIERVRALPGYSRFKLTSLTFRECPFPEACLGGVNSTCLDGGYTGSRCAACSKGYAYDPIKGAHPPKCYDCASGAYSVMNLPIIILNFLWFFILAWLIRRINLRRGSQAVNLVKSFVTYLQMTALAKNLDLSWPDSVKQFLLLAEKLSLLDIRSSAFKCAFNWNFYQNFAFHELLPISLGVMLFIYFTIVKYVEELKEEMAKARIQASKKKSANADDSAEEDNNDSKVNVGAQLKKDDGAAGLEESWQVNAYDKIISWLVVALWLLYPTLVQYFIEFTQCTGSHGDEDRHFVSDYSLQCAGPLYSTLWVVVVVCMILYGLGIPMLLLHMLTGEDITSSHNSVLVQYRFGLLFKGLDIKCTWWWEWVIFGRKFALIIVVIVFQQSQVFGGYCANCLLQFFFLLHIIARPHVSVEHGRIETNGLLTAMATFTGGLIFAQSSSVDSTGSSGGLIVFMTTAFFVAHFWTWYTFVRTLRALFKEEGEEAMISRAVRDLEFEDEVVDHFDNKRDAAIIQQEALAREHERIRLRGMVGERLPFADDDLLDAIKRDSTIDIRTEHKELSAKLEDLREKWKERNAQRDDRHVALDERHLSNMERRASKRADQNENVTDKT